MRQWRVGTLTMGILLITAGIVSMLSQFKGISILASIIKWWPVVLILLGLEIIIFNVFLKEDKARVKFDGFSIFIILLILLFASGASVFQGFIKGNFPKGYFYFSNNSKYRTELNKSLTIDTEGKNNLIVSNNLGNIHIEKSTGNSVEVEAKITVMNNDEEYAKSLQDSIIKVEKSSSIKIFAESNSSLNAGNRIQNITVNYLIKVPQNLNIEVENKFGKVEVSDVKGDAKISNSNGDIIVSRITGSLNTEVRFGKTNVNSVAGDVKIDASNGDVTIENIGGKVDVNNKFGRIDILETAKGINVSNSNGDILINNSKSFNSDVTVENKFGKISLNIPENQEGHYKCYTKFGNINSTLSFLNITKENTGATCQGTLGSSNVQFKINNSNGDINMFKR